MVAQQLDELSVHAAWCFDSTLAVFVPIRVTCVVLDKVASRVSTRAAVVLV